jgi:alpha-L-fucosidase
MAAVLVALLLTAGTARFRPDRFDPAPICSLAKQAGMRYVVITSKHHDGFSMFDTATTDYDRRGLDAVQQGPAEAAR